MAEMHKTEIDGMTFQQPQLLSTQGLLTFFKLVKALGGAFPAVAKAMRKDAPPLEAFGALMVAFQNTSPEELVELSKVVLTDCIVTQPGGKTVRLSEVYEVLLQGKLMTNLELIAWGLKVNYSTFFIEWLSRIAELTAAKANASGSAESSSTSGQPTA